MKEPQDIDSAIAYFESQSDLSPFAAQVAKWLTELKDARQKISILELSAKINAGLWAHRFLCFLCFFAFQVFGLALITV